MLQLLRTPMCALLLLAWAPPVSAQPDGVSVLVHEFETALQSGDPAALDPLLAPTFDRAALQGLTERWFSPAITRATARERDRVDAPDPAGAQRLSIETLLEHGAAAGRLLTWQATVTEVDAVWRFTALRVVTTVEGLYRLALDTSRQFRARNLKFIAEDFQLLLADGNVFVSSVPSGVTAVVILGKGEMTFSPAPETERRQLEIFAGRPTIKTAFRYAFVRLNVNEYESLFTHDALVGVPVSPRALQAAQQVFREESGKTYAVDLADLSRDAWSLLPPFGDMVAEVRTDRFGTLTYVRSAKDPEDVTLFDRVRRRNISVYASRDRLASRGPFYNEDDGADYDVLEYGVDTTFSPERLWFDGRATLRLQVRSPAVSSLVFRLNSALTVRSVTSDRHGRLLFLRVKNQDSLVVNLPGLTVRGSEMTLSVTYSGRLEPQPIEREALGVGQGLSANFSALEPESSFIYSNRSYWYPQSQITDYATATIRFTLPPEHAVVCSGTAASGSPVTLSRGGVERLLFVFAARQPVRYLGCVVSRFVSGEPRVIRVTGVQGQSPDDSRSEQTLTLHAQFPPRQRARSRDLLDQAEDIAQFYANVMQDVPYPDFTIAVIESLVPGGHSPPYFAALNQPLPGTPLTWEGDPTTFESYPEFFLAHELAHQWWGQAVGWRNYHEQWLSEGFSQYFAALYAERRRGPAVFGSVIRQMSRWAIRSSDEGPVYLGYRLGHLKNDSRVLRALIYNKGAMVLHMLRRLTGDDAFFRAIRRFYSEHRFSKGGTDTLRQAFETETGLEFSRFFDRWIYGWTLPVLKYTSETDKSGARPALVVRFEQGDQVFDFAVTVTLRFADRTVREVTLPIRDRRVEHRIPLEGALRSVQVNRDRAVLLKGD